ncbi:Periplasmic murein peptide-binding protein precursor [Cedecea neteri]|uniref:Periplasmic murein peptide-binding protein n=1 Tax=Cedecea neteri TaxID=158822 RepID=A0A2X3L522_9ENTR|nr:Periplasmic murein peptide-binding protein precursor [Cedecea neteri]
MKASGRKLATLAVLISLVTPFSYASELVIAQPASATAMDPGFLKEAATLVDNIFDTLVLRDKNMQLQPGLATSWKALDDTTWQFDLRPGVTFTNGEPVNAAAVKFSIDRILDPGQPRANHFLHPHHLSRLKSPATIRFASTPTARTHFCLRA